jgi:prepilin-type processing-associated H-X9-DG protein
MKRRAIERQHMKTKIFQRRLPCLVEDRAQVAAFTLIEFFVVIASITILAVALLPAFAGTRQNSQGVGCMDNQRQLADAWMMFARDNNDVLVPNRGLNGATGVNYAGDPRIEPQLQPGGANADWCPGNLQNPSDTISGGKYPAGSIYSWWIQTSLLYPYVRNIQAYHCPADHSTVPRGATVFAASALRTYSMNDFVQPMDAPGYASTPWNGGPNTGYYFYTKLSNMFDPGPSKTWVFIEESQYTIDDCFFGVDPRETVQWVNSPAILHGNASVLAFADGHTDTHRWTDSSMVTAKPSNPAGTIDGWPADPRSGDLAWFNSISTAPN